MFTAESDERRATPADVFAARGPRHRSGRQRTGPFAQRHATHGPASGWPQAPACRSDHAGKIILGTALAVAAALVLACLFLLVSMTGSTVTGVVAKTGPAAVVAVHGTVRNVLGETVPAP